VISEFNKGSPLQVEEVKKFDTAGGEEMVDVGEKSQGRAIRTARTESRWVL